MTIDIVEATAHSNTKHTHGSSGTIARSLAGTQARGARSACRRHSRSPETLLSVSTTPPSVLSMDTNGLMVEGVGHAEGEYVSMSVLPTGDQPPQTPGGDATTGQIDLPAGWSERYSQQHQCPYYRNAATGESSWTRPGGDATRTTGQIPAVAPAQLVVTGGSAAVPLTSLSKKVSLEPWTAEGVLNAAYFQDKDDEAAKGWGTKMKDMLHGIPPCIDVEDGSLYKNVDYELKNTRGDLPSIVERLSAHDAEAESLHAAQSAPVRLESCLSPNETVIASIPCVGFDGFPDWGLNERQQRVGHCVLAIVGTMDQSADKPCRIVMLHSGRMRGISAKEMDVKCCCAGESSASWDIERRQDSALAVLWTRTQLVAISSERLDRLSITKAAGKQNKCFYMLLLLLPMMVCVGPFALMAIPFLAMAGASVFLWLCMFSIIMYTIKSVCLGKTSVFGVDATEKQELQELIVTAEEYESKAERGGFISQSKDEWHAALYQFKYRAISLYCADPCTDRTFEAIAVVQPSVSSDEIARFVLLADQHKMDRSSAKAQDLKFVPHIRSLRRSAKHGGMDLDLGADVAAATGIENPLLRFALVSFLISATFGMIIPVYMLYKLGSR